MRSPERSVPGGHGVARALARVALVAFVALAVVLLAPAALAASPDPTDGPGGDPRSPGEGPGLVGDPVMAILVVAAVGLGALVVTLAYVRATGGPRDGQADRPHDRADR